MDGSIRQAETGKEGSFFYTENDNKLGEMHYRLTGNNVMIIDHTEVDSSMEGKGVGKKLVEYAVNYLREKQLKVIPTCTYANAVFRRHPEWNDLLYRQPS